MGLPIPALPSRLNAPVPSHARPNLHGREIVPNLSACRNPADLKGAAGRADVGGMKTVLGLVSQLARDERGGEVLEYALVAGLLVVSAIAVIGSVGTKILARWTSLDSSL